MTKRLDAIRLGSIILLVLTGARFLFHILSGSDFHTYLVTDDFYYYFLPAKNLVSQGISSFDGITITNGYHPLWFICNVVLYAISGMNDGMYFILLAGLSGVLTYLFLTKLQELVTLIFGELWLYDILLALTAVIYAGLCFLGMETTILLPLLTTLLVSLLKTNFETAAPTRYLYLGFLSSLVILSRLDTLFLVGMLCIGMLFLMKGKIFSRLMNLVWIALGMILLPTYFLFNYISYGEFLTVSALVKTLGTTKEFNVDAFLYILTNRDSAGALFLAPLGLIAIVLSRSIKKQAKIILGILLAFPFVFYPIILYQSSWFLNRWYLYPLPMVSLVSVLCIIHYFSERLDIFKRLPHYTKSASLLTTSFMVVFGAYFFLRDTILFEPDPHSVYTHAKKMQPFVATHPGIYAMGDRAGLTAYLIGQPVIQLEGLACDHSMVRFMRERTDLQEVLRHYNVQYLIESADDAGLDAADNCYHLEEPHKEQAGELTPKMTSTLCRHPEAIIETKTAGYGVKTYIFDISKDQN
jgi:hypothetical protein